MLAHFDDLAPLHHHQPVGLFERRQAMGNRDRRSPADQVVERQLNSRSVVVSTLDVASSRIRIRGLINSARAIEIRCRSPPDKNCPRSPTSEL